MPHNIEPIMVLMAIVFGCAQVLEPRAQEADLDIAGMYVLWRDGSSTLEISAADSHYVASLAGGGSEAAGPAAPADCYVRAMGRLEGKILVADFAALQTETFSYSGAQAKKERRQLKIMFGPGIAEVISADTHGYCGLGASFVGHYHRR